MVSVAGYCAFKWEWRRHRQLLVKARLHELPVVRQLSDTQRVRVKLSSDQFGSCSFTVVRGSVAGFPFNSALVIGGRV